MGRQVLGQREQTIGFAAHRGRNDDELMSLAVESGHAPGYVADALGAANGGAPILLNDQSHG